MGAIAHHWFLSPFNKILSLWQLLTLNFVTEGMPKSKYFFMKVRSVYKQPETIIGPETDLQ